MILGLEQGLITDLCGLPVYFPLVSFPIPSCCFPDCKPFGEGSLSVSLACLVLASHPIPRFFPCPAAATASLTHSPSRVGPAPPFLFPACGGSFSLSFVALPQFPVRDCVVLCVQLPGPRPAQSHGQDTEAEEEAAWIAVAAGASGPA